MGVYDPFWYIRMSPGSRCHMELYFVGAELDYASDLGSEVGSLVFFLLGGPGS